MAWLISSDAHAAMLAHAAAQPDEEVCGLLFGAPGRVDKAMPCANVAADRCRHFELDPAALVAAYRAARGGGPAIVGHYHSHPGGDPRFSALDRASSAGDGALWIVIGHGGATGAAISDAPASLTETSLRITA